MVRTEEKLKNVIETYSDMILKLTLSYVRDYDTAEDITQTVFVKYMVEEKVFTSEEHQKAWLLRVAINECKKHFRSYWYAKRSEFPSEEYLTVKNEEGHPEVLEAIYGLPMKYREVIHLYYYEELSVKEISSILGRKENTIMSDLHRARKLLKRALEESYG